MKAAKIFFIIIGVCVLLFTGCSFEDKLFVAGLTDYSNQNQFILCIEKGAIERAEEILSNIENDELRQKYINSALKSGYNPQMMYNDNKSLQWLIENGANPNYDEAVFQTAYNSGYYQYLCELLKSDKIDTNDLDSAGHTALQSAVHSNDLYNAAKSVEGMLAYGYSVEKYIFESNDLGSDPYIAKLLIETAEKDGIDTGFSTALQYAMSGNIKDCLEALENSSVNEEEKERICKYVSIWGTPEEFEIACKTLGVKCKPDFNAVCYNDNATMFEYTAKLYENSGQQDRFLNQASNFSLKTAVANGSSEICNFIATTYPNIELTVPESYISLAVASGNPKMVEIILDWIYPDINTAEQQFSAEYQLGLGFKALRHSKDIAVQKEIADVFFKKGFDFRYFNFRYIGKEMAEYLYSKGRPLCPTDLYWAVKQDNAEFVSLVLEKGANPNEYCFNELDNQMWDSSKNISKMLNIESEDLITYSYLNSLSNLNLNRTADSALSYDVVKVLLDNGLDLSLFPRILVSGYKSDKAVILLIENGAETKINDIQFKANGKKYNLIQYYNKQGRDDIVKILKDAGVKAYKAL